MKGQFYAGQPMDGVPLRIGEGFTASTIDEARRKIVGILRAENRDYALVCHISGNSVTIHGTVSAEGFKSQCYKSLGKFVTEDAGCFEGTWQRIRGVRH